MTRIIQVTVDGLAGRSKPVSYELDKQTNIFYGPNGSGKTSILRILFSALLDDVAHIRRVPFDRASVSYVDKEKDGVITRTISSDKLVEIPIPAPTTFMTANGPITLPINTPQRGWDSQGKGANEQIMVSYLSIFRLFGDQTMNFWGGGQESPYSESRLDQQFFQLVHNRWVNYSNTLLTQVRALQDEGIQALLGSLFVDSPKESERQTDKANAYLSLSHFFESRNLAFNTSEIDFSKQFDSDFRIQKAVHDLESVEHKISAVERPRRQLEDLVQRFLSTNKKIRFSEGSIDVLVGDKTIDIGLLSSGEKHLLRILLECLSAYGNCIIVDEPELSLHIDWQKELVPAMRTVNPDLQVIMATHSPEILAGIGLNQIFELD